MSTTNKIKAAGEALKMGFDCREMTKAYRARNGTVKALEKISFTVHKEELLCIVGPSGCGKTTLLKLIAGLLEPTSGEIAFYGDPPDSQPRTALVFQDHGLFPWMTVVDNVAFGLEMRGIPRKERHDRALVFIKKVGLADFAHSYPNELSIGMRQRVGIARAFLTDPQILLMDEPFGSLDAQTRRVLQEELLKLWKKDRKMVVYVTHDIEEAILLGDRVLVMTGRPGSILEEILVPLERPRNPSATMTPEATRIKKHVWEVLEEEVRRSLRVAG